MSVQVSTRIDEATKKQFDQVCERIGTSPSNALSMFIKSVINSNGIPFPILAQQQVTHDAGVASPQIPHRAENYKNDGFKFGGWEGKISMPEDFNAPMEEFEDYM